MTVAVGATAVPAASANTGVSCPGDNTNSASPLSGALAPTSGPFSCLAPGFTATLVGTGDTGDGVDRVGQGMAYGGVSFTPAGDPIVSGSGNLTKFDMTTSVTVHGQTVHPIAKSVGWSGCGGAVNTADGRIFIQNNDSGTPMLVDPNTLGAVPQYQALSGCWGTTVDPLTGNYYYAYVNGPYLIFADPNFNFTGYSFTQGGVDGMSWEPTGQHVFGSTNGYVSVWDRNGTTQSTFGLDPSLHSGTSLGQSVDGGTGGTDGIAFASGAQKYVVTNNTDGSISRFDFPNGDFTQHPTETVIAWGGSRGDNTEVGADGCLYLTQRNTHYNDGTIAPSPSLVRLCGSGFVPPVGLAASFNATEGQPVTAQLGTFQDHDTSLTASSFLATVNWGDGSPTEPGTVTSDPAAAGSYLVTAGPHTFTSGPSAHVSVTVTAGGTAVTSFTTTGTVADAPLTPAGDSAAITLATGGQLNGTIGAFTDANPLATADQLSAVTDFGDGTTPATAPALVSTGNGSFSVNGAHTYSTPGNYTLSTVVTDIGGQTVTLTRTVTVAAPTVVTITAQDADTTYGKQLPHSYAYTVSGLSPGDTLTTNPVCAPTATDVSQAGSYPIRCSSAAVSAGYTLSYIDGTLNVAKAPLTVTADNVHLTYGNSLPATFTSAVTGLVGNDTLTKNATCVAATAATNVGDYAISCSGADGGSNYTVSYAPGSLSIAPATVVLTPQVADRSYGTPDAITYTATGLVPGDALLTQPVCSATRPDVNVGTYSAICTGANAGTNYTLDQSTTTTFKVTPAPLTVTPASATKIYGTSTPAFTSTTTGLLLGDTWPTLPVCAPSTNIAQVGSYPIGCTTVSMANYAITVSPATFSITTAAGAVTPNPQTKVYRSDDPTFSYAVSGLLTGDTLAVQPHCGVAGAHANVGSSYLISCAGGDGSPSYTLDQSATALLSITAAPVRIVPNDQTMVYGTKAPAFTYATHGLLGADQLTTSATCGVAGDYTQAGTYTISCKNADAGGNYTVTTQTATLTVTKATATVVPTNQSITYGDSDPAYGYAVTGLVGADTLATPAACSVPTAHSQHGTYPITCTGANGGNNYTVIQSATATLTVAKRALSITVANANRLYDQNNPVLGGTVVGVTNADPITVGYTTPATRSSDVGAYPITAVASGAGLDNYTVTVNPAVLSIAQMPTSLVITSPSAQSANGTFTVTYALTENVPTGTGTGTGTVAVNGQPVTVNAAAVAKTVSSPSQADFTLANGSYAVTAAFAGSKNYLGSVAAAQTVYSYQPSQFVIWGGNTSGVSVGKNYTFWGSQWASQVTGGDYQATSAFKGYANTLTGSTWTTSSGGSANQPSTIGQYICVIVATHISKPGSDILGDVKKTVVIKVDSPSSYAPNPGHSASGAIQTLL